MEEPLLNLVGASRSYRAGQASIPVLRGIDLTIRAGEFVAIMGASGSGKSTLMNLLGCLDRPSDGHYRVAGVDVGALPPDELARLRRERFGFIFQRYHLLPHLSAAQNVQVPAVYAGIARHARASRAHALLAQLGLAERAAYRPNQLSGGQQQRVSIARALMNGADVILADEPTGALDSRSGREVMRILGRLHADGKTIVVVTHDEHVAAHADRIVEMRDGVIVSDRSRRERPPVGRASPFDSSPVGRGDHRRLARLGHALSMAWAALTAHRLRTLLTMLGIVIGITSVVSISAIGAGAKRYVLDEIRATGTSTIDVYPGRDWGDSDAERIKTLVPADAAALAAEPYVDSATPNTYRPATARYRNIDARVMIGGVGEHFFRVRGLSMASGMAFGANAVRRHAQVAVIDENTRRTLFGDAGDPIGRTIIVDNVPCTIIGATVPKGSWLGGGMRDLTIWLPYTTAATRVFGSQRLDGIAVRVKDGQSGAAAERSIVQLLTRRHGRKDFFTYNVDSVIKTVESTGRTLTLLLALIGVVSLVVGGIGVMNIMLVSVTERTREIGVRMAVGARRADVLLQFLVEAIVVCLMGGAIGVALSFSLSFIFSAVVQQWRMIFSTGAVVSAVACSTAIGIAFGFMPARRAARLDPVQALARD